MLADSPFTGEGHRKVWARLRQRGIRTSKARTLGLMRQADLLAPGGPRRVLGPRVHDGTIVTAALDLMWGTDATGAWMLEDGLVSIFAVVERPSAWGSMPPSEPRAGRRSSRSGKASGAASAPTARASPPGCSCATTTAASP